MLRHVIGYAVGHRGVFAALAAVLMLYGGYVATQGRLDVFPEFVPPQVAIQTEAPGLAPDQVEILVTRPVEQAVSGIPATERVSSESIAGLSVVTVVFAESADVYLTRQGVAERLTELGPEDLNRDLTLMLEVMSQHHYGHATAAELADNGILLGENVLEAVQQIGHSTKMSAGSSLARVWRKSRIRPWRLVATHPATNCGCIGPGSSGAARQSTQGGRRKKAHGYSPWALPLLGSNQDSPDPEGPL